MSLRVVPCSLRQAREFVQKHHRHHDMPQGGLWAVALLRDGETSLGNAVTEVVGVAIAGRPVSRVLQRAGFCEIIRVCVIEGIPDGCSRLYGRCRRIAQAFGYVRTVTYTLASETGSSLRGAGFCAVAHVKGESWDRKKRRRVDTHPTEPKTRWEAT